MSMTTDNKAPREFDELKHSKLYKNASITDRLKMVIDFRHYTMESGADANIELFKYLLPEVIEAYDKLQSRIEKCEELLKEMSPVLEDNFIIYHDCGDMDNEQVIECHGKIQKYFAEVEK